MRDDDEFSFDTLLGPAVIVVIVLLILAMGA